ncbi:MAG TPA: hypothetical protein VH372_06640 [Actinospica sp.]|jgi:hypothetical protein|nr:hypothetical protein [Actinospica sp.]
MTDEPVVYPPPLFLYQVTPTVVPHGGPGAPSSANLMFFVSNNSGHDVEVDQIVFDLRYGNGPGDLTTNDNLVPQPVVGPDWNAANQGGGRVRVAPRGEAEFRGLRAGESLGVAVPGVVVNTEPGVANLIVWESSDELRQTYVSVAKTTPGLAITSFQASPVQLDRNHPDSVLSWRTTGSGAQVTLSHSGTTKRVDKDGHEKVRPKVTTLYTLTATAGGQSVHEQLAVYVPQVTLISFGADPPLMEGGRSSTLRWLLLNATSAMILASGDEPDPGKIALPDGELVVTPRRLSTTYTLTAEGFGNSVTGVAQVDLVPTVEQFSLSPLQAPRGLGLPLSLAWRVRDTTAVSISGLSTPQPAVGTAELRPTQTSSYTISAKRLAPRTVRAHLAGQITFFRAIAGANTIVWRSAGADLAQLRINGAMPVRTNLEGDRYVGPGRSTLYLISTAADWANYVDVDLQSVAGSATVTATCDYGINAVGATVRLEWSIPFGAVISVANGSARYAWKHDESPRTFVVGPSTSSATWQLTAPGTVMTVYPGQSWASAEQSTEGAIDTDSDSLADGPGRSLGEGLNSSVGGEGQ